MHPEDIELAIEVEEEEEVEDQWYAINVNNQDIMKNNVHFHL
jgi:hypothetical protein